VDLLQGGWCAADRGLADEETQLAIGFENAEELDAVAEDFIVKRPTLQIGDGRCFGIFVVPMDDTHSKKVRPSGFEVAVGIGSKPDLMLIAFIVGWTTQFSRRGVQVEVFFTDVVPENSEFFLVIGRTSLKARNCFTAAS